MGFFSKVRKRIKKIIPKEIRPFIPYIAAGFSGPIGAKLGMSGLSSMYQKGLIGAGAKFLSDDEADLKDIATTGILAAAPTALSEYGNSSMMGNEYAKTAGDYLADKKLTTLAAQGSIDAGIKAAELNEDALDKYNRELAAQGINDKAGRRAAIRGIYANTGTWDMDEVDSMLDTYGYRTGGRVGYYEGDMVLPMPSQISPERRNQIEGNKIAEQAFEEIFEKFNEKFPGIATGEETLEEMIAMLQAENVMDYAGDEMGILGLDRSMDMITPESVGRSTQRIMRGDTQYGDVPGPEDDVGDYGKGLMYGGRVGYNKGGITTMEELLKEDEKTVDEESSDISMTDTVKGTILDTPSKKKRKSKKDSKKDDEDLLDNIGAMQKSYSILYPEVKENRIRPLSFEDGGSVDDRLMERVKELQDEGLDFASALSQAMKEDMAANKARGGIMDGIDINMREQIDTPRGDMMIDENIKVADSSLMDAYEIYRFDMMEQGLEPMSIEEFKDQAMAEGKMANMDYREFIYDASRDNFANDMFGKDYGDLNEEETEEVDIIIEMELGKNQAAPERTMAASGGLMNLGGREMDLRGGGFVPMGAKERADDVPARLSKNEFVMTADAVRAAGGGSVQKGADLMYDQMKQLERQA
ncbi:hypothetical protein N9C03_00845 [bacterium]|nr:hypothetical protein [bacterium]